jgi:hypothetical protein
MSRPTPARATAVAALAALGLTLCACGKTGELQRPGPLFHTGAAAPAEPPQTQGQDPSRPVSTVDPRDPGSLAPTPPRTQPIEGQSPDPLGVRPQGSIPDPYANPQR